MRLSSLDSGAENAARVVGFFDALIEQRADIKTVLSQAAVFAECPVGISEPGEPGSVVGTPSGVVARGSVPVEGLTRVFGTGHTVWISRTARQSFALDQIFLERFGLACIAALGRSGVSDLHLGDPALLELILGRLPSNADRSRAIQLLGITPATSVTMLAAHGDQTVVAKLIASFPPRVWRSVAQIGEVAAIAISGAPDRDMHVPEGLRVGVSSTCPAAQLPGAWQGATNALRFVGDTPGSFNPVFQSDLGPYELLAARLHPDELAEVGDVQALARLSETAAGRDSLQTIEMLLRVGSLRKAASQLHLHHNSVAARVVRAEAELGYSITGPQGMARLTLALAMRKLSRNSFLS
jgi:PucR C-terminal helix-turn-helix domain